MKTQTKELAAAFLSDQDKFRNLILDLPVALYTTDQAGYITLYNEPAAELWGRSPVIGEDMWCGSWKIFHADGSRMPLDQCPMAITLKTGVAARGHEINVERPDGRRAWVQPHPQPLRDGEGNIVGAVNMLVDVTQRRESENALREREERLRAVLSQAAVGIAILDRDGRFLEVNARLCQMMKRSVEQFTALTCGDVTHPDDWKYNEKLMSELISGAISEFTLEKRYLRGDGEFVWANVSVSPILDAEGEPDRMVSIIEDISLRKHAEEQIQEMNRMLEARVVERTAQLESFCYSIAHDLRQHIRGVSLNAHFVKEGLPEMDEELSQCVDRLVASAKNMDRLVSDLLRHARTSRQDVRREDLDISALATEAALQLRQQYPDVDIQVQPGLRTAADPAAISVVLQNLLDNACKYSSPKRRSTVRFGRSDDVFYVHDNGIGFDMAHSEQLFQPFQRLHRETEVPGTGLGLSSVKQIVEKHGGSVWATSEVGHGATFFFTLPSSDPIVCL